MKTEIEQLEENAKIEYTKQRVEELGKEITVLQEQRCEMKRWERRTATLNFANILAFWTIIIYSAATDLPHTVSDVATDYWLLIFFFLIIREHYFNRQYEYFDGKIDGIFVALDLLYPDNNRDEGGNARRKVKRRSMFKRFKEFWERVGQGKTKEVPA